MNIFIVFCLVFFSQNPADYRMDIGEHFDSELHEMPSGYVEAYTVLDAEGNQRYVLSIAKVSMPDASRMPDVYGDTYKNEILSKCNCTIPSIEAKNYSHFTGNQFELLRNGQSTYVLSFLKKFLYLGQNKQNLPNP